MHLNELQESVLEIAKEKNWGTSPDEIIFGEKIALLHAEISEALEAYRKGQMTGRDSVAEELADAVMRIMQLAGIYKIDLEKEILDKLEINKNRDWNNDQLYKDRDKRENK
ncbi:hypothetical protein ACFL29_00680 [Patescibacteria group bacterium]